MLLGLYRDLAHMVIAADLLNQWRADGRLLGNIKEKFLQRPAHLRGEHFAWLLRNEHVLAEMDMEKRVAEREE